jgi:ketosteroid isomerase-like protein
MFKRRSAVGGALLAAALMPLAWAQSGDERAVAAAVEQLRVAMLHPDRDTLQALIADDVSYGHSDSHLDTKVSLIESVLTGRSANTALDFGVPQIGVHGDVAVVRNLFVADTFNSGKPGHVDLKVLQVWQKRGASWQLIARQAVRNAPAPQ